MLPPATHTLSPASVMVTFIFSCGQLAPTRSDRAITAVSIAAAAPAVVISIALVMLSPYVKWIFPWQLTHAPHVNSYLLIKLIGAGFGPCVSDVSLSGTALEAARLVIILAGAICF